jgi:broad specificity phosphatase PhoE
MNNVNIPLKPFYFIRHGQTDWNKERKAMGQTDIPLNQTGLEQAAFAAESLRTIEFDIIVSSPLSRALQTAEIIAEKKNKPILIFDEFKEGSWGVFEGKNTGCEIFLQHWMSGNEIEGAEHRADFLNRVRQGLVKALSGPEIVLIVSHGGVYGAIQETLGLPLCDLENCTPMLCNPMGQSVDGWDVQVLQASYNHANIIASV